MGELATPLFAKQFDWRKELREAGEQAFPGEGKPRDEELAKLRRELRRVEQERDILKKP
jgi:transposase